MRIRQIKPAFWTDKVIAAMPPRTRLTYIALWQMADDAGWIAWEVEQAGAEILPYETPKMRERWLTQDLERLIDAGRVVRHECGHLEIPTLRKHQHPPARLTLSVLNAHQRECSRMFADVRSGRDREGIGKGEGREGSLREKIDIRPDVAARLGIEPAT